MVMSHLWGLDCKECFKNLCIRLSLQGKHQRRRRYFYQDSKVRLSIQSSLAQE